MLFDKKNKNPAVIYSNRDEKYNCLHKPPTKVIAC